MSMFEDTTEITEFDIEIRVPIKVRVATCDFCSQGNQKCFYSPNSSPDKNNEGRDICKNCVAIFYGKI